MGLLVFMEIPSQGIFPLPTAYFGLAAPRWTSMLLVPRIQLLSGCWYHHRNDLFSHEWQRNGPPCFPLFSNWFPLCNAKRSSRRTAFLSGSKMPIFELRGRWHNFNVTERLFSFSFFPALSTTIAQIDVKARGWILNCHN